MQIMPVPTLMCFNPRPHARGDRTCLEPLDGHPCFNPRPHARGDEAGKPHLTGSLSFNPRPHTRGDLIEIVVGDRQLVSIHAPTRGATYQQKQKKLE